MSLEQIIIDEFRRQALHLIKSEISNILDALEERATHITELEYLADQLGQLVRQQEEKAEIEQLISICENFSSRTTNSPHS